MESGPTLWLILLTLGVAALGIAMAYGMSRNRTRTSAEKRLTEVATKHERDVEDRDHS